MRQGIRLCKTGITIFGILKGLFIDIVGYADYYLILGNADVSGRDQAERMRHGVPDIGS